MQTYKTRYFLHSYPDLRGLLLVVLAGGWLAGILTNSWLLWPIPVLLIVGIPAPLLLSFGWRRSLLRLGGLTLLCYCLGAWRYAVVSPNNDVHAVRSWIGSAVLQVEGEIADDPHLESNSTLLTVNAQSVSLDNGQSWQEVHGQIQVQIFGSTFDDPYAPRYGDRLQLTGRLAAPPGYATPELQASMAFPRMSIKSRANASFMLFFYQIRSHLAGILLQALPQPFAALLIAILLSQRTPSLKPLLQPFNVTGTAHLIAPSAIADFYHLWQGHFLLHILHPGEKENDIDPNELHRAFLTHDLAALIRGEHGLL